MNNRYLLIFLVLASANVSAGVSKWVDENNQVHYSDRPPPPDARVKSVRTISDSTGSASSVPETSTPASPKSVSERDADWKKAQKGKNEAADKTAKKQAADEAKKASCASAQQYLRTLQEGMRMVEVDANGERTFMDDSQREELIAKTQKDISTNCK
jgi:Domain of unknown function (DUF4124)